jgi:hypothetical protein
MNDETITTTNASPGTLALEALIKDAALGPEETEQEKKKKSLKLMQLNFALFAATLEPMRMAFCPRSPFLKIDSLAGLSNSSFGDESEGEPVATEDMYLVEPEIVTSSGRKVPKRNPKAKAWVSPYGNRRK